MFQSTHEMRQSNCSIVGQSCQDWYEQASRKLADGEKSGKFGQYASIMKGPVRDALDSFCKQDGEFAQAVVQGGSFEDCMKEVSKNCGSALSDLEAYRRAVKFYFAEGKRVVFWLGILDEGDDREPVLLTQEQRDRAFGKDEKAEPAPRKRSKILSLDDFLV